MDLRLNKLTPRMCPALSMGYLIILLCKACICCLTITDHNADKPVTKNTTYMTVRSAIGVDKAHFILLTENWPVIPLMHSSFL